MIIFHLTSSQALLISCFGVFSKKILDSQKQKKIAWRELQRFVIQPLTCRMAKFEVRLEKNHVFRKFLRTELQQGLCLRIGLQMCFC